MEDLLASRRGGHLDVVEEGQRRQVVLVLIDGLRRIAGHRDVVDRPLREQRRDPTATCRGEGRGRGAGIRDRRRDGQLALVLIVLVAFLVLLFLFVFLVVGIVAPDRGLAA